jgi:hypothetical protein
MIAQNFNWNTDVVLAYNAYCMVSEFVFHKLCTIQIVGSSTVFEKQNLKINL